MDAKVDFSRYYAVLIDSVTLWSAPELADLAGRHGGAQDNDLADQARAERPWEGAGQLAVGLVRVGESCGNATHDARSLGKPRNRCVIIRTPARNWSLSGPWRHFA